MRHDYIDKRICLGHQLAVNTIFTIWIYLFLFPHTISLSTQTIAGINQAIVLIFIILAILAIIDYLKLKHRPAEPIPAPLISDFLFHLSLLPVAGLSTLAGPEPHILKRFQRAHNRQKGERILLEAWGEIRQPGNRHLPWKIKKIAQKFLEGLDHCANLNQGDRLRIASLSREFHLEFKEATDELNPQEKKAFNGLEKLKQQVERRHRQIE